MIETKYECDFCLTQVTTLWPVNAGLWAICRNCMDHIFGIGEKEMTEEEE